MLSAEIHKVLSLHEDWLESGGESGRQAILENVDLSQLNLSNANLTCSVLTGANLNRTNLDGAVLENADLRGAMLRYSSLIGTNLSNSNLANASFDGADLTDATLVSSYIKESSFEDACLYRANLTDVSGPSASFVRSNLVRCILDDSDFHNGRFEQANLTNATLERVSLRGADLSGAKVVGVRFGSVDTKNVVANEGLLKRNVSERSESVEMLAERNGRVKALQQLFLLSGCALLGVFLLGLFATVLAGFVDLYNFLQFDETMTPSSFPYLIWISITIASAIVGNVLLFFRLRLDSVTFPDVGESTNRDVNIAS